MYNEIMKNILSIFIIVLLTSCASTQVVSNSVVSESYRQSYDEVWTKVIRFFATNQISIGTLEKDSGIVTLKGDRLDRDLINSYCSADANSGFLEVVVYGNVTGSVNVIDEGGFVTVTVNTRFSSVHNDGYFVPRACASTGAFEQSILDTI
tara:strand:- start:1459 stop:1911 length:453 start_codon:yes stop_codon:yes gene_type:complete